MTKGNSDTSKNSGLGSQDPDKKKKDGKPKKDFNSWSYYIAWFGFLTIVGSALFNLIKKMDPPDRNEYYT